MDEQRRDRASILYVGHFTYFDYWYPVINGAGRVSWRGQDTLGLGIFSGDGGSPFQGIYTGPDPVADKVIAEGDMLGGETILDILFLRGWNDAGEVAFVALVDPGGGASLQGRVYLARPTVPAVPLLGQEEGWGVAVLSLGLLGAGGAALSLRSRAQRT